MGYLEKIKSIRLKLIEEHHQDIADEILKLQLSGGTGGEVLIMVCSELLKIKRNHGEIYNHIEHEVSELVSYANSIGLFPK